MKTRLIIVEGLPASGKSTTARLIAKNLNDHGIHALCFDEGDHDHPADPPEYDFPDFETERKGILENWRNFVKSARKDTVYVFNGVLLQNPITESMFRFDRTEEEIRSYIHEIARIIEPLHPAILYIDQPGIEYYIDQAIEERGKEWLNMVIDYHTGQAFWKRNRTEDCTDPYFDYLTCLNLRKEFELDLLKDFPIDAWILSQDLGVEEFLDLYQNAGWNPPEKEQAELALSNTCLSLVLRHQRKAEAMLRWIGDETMSLLLKDFVVDSKHRGYGIGSLLYQFSENAIRKDLNASWKICLNVNSVPEMVSFYESMGLKVLPDGSMGPGMQKMLEK